MLGSLAARPSLVLTAFQKLFPVGHVGLAGHGARPVRSPIFLATSAELPSAPASRYRQIRLSQLILVAVDLELCADSAIPNTIHVAIVRLRVMYSNITDRAFACFAASSSFPL
jgi:hypothetical protein